MFKTIQRFFRGAFHPQHRGLGSSILLVALAAGAMGVAGKSLMFGGLGLGLFAVFIWVARMGMEDLDRFDAQRMDAAATRWVQSADTEDEAEDRYRMVGTLGAAGAMAAAGGMALNVDGTPMAAGSDVDIYGRVYGDTSDDATNFDVGMPLDEGTGLVMDPSDAYSSPFHGDH